ncbi:hypothetical protein DIPPA_19476 [Diplonema papillatum]|nr:hypothetical protein DIPPA_19476 [Diplonema papillatum]
MKELKSKVTEGGIDVLSVCPVLDVFAVASGNEVSVYRMPLSKVVAVPMADAVQGFSWAPNGRMLAVGCENSVVLVNVEDGLIVNEYKAPSTMRDLQALHRPTSGKGEAKATPRLHHFFEGNFEPLRIPGAEDQPVSTANLSKEALRLRFTTADEAATAVAAMEHHFLTAITPSPATGPPRVTAFLFGTGQPFQAELDPRGDPAARPLTSADLDTVRFFPAMRVGVALTKAGSVLAVASEGAVAESLRAVGKAGVTVHAVEEALGVAKETLAQLSAAAAKAEKAVALAVGDGAPGGKRFSDLRELFLHGPLTPTDFSWAASFCAPDKIGKAMEHALSALAGVATVLRTSVSSAILLAQALSEALEVQRDRHPREPVEPGLFPGGLRGWSPNGTAAPGGAGFAGLRRRLLPAVAAAVAAVCSLQADAYQLLAWLIEVSRFCTATMRLTHGEGPDAPAERGGDAAGRIAWAADPVSDQREVMRIVSDGNLRRWTAATTSLRDLLCAVHEAEAECAAYAAQHCSTLPGTKFTMAPIPSATLASTDRPRSVVLRHADTSVLFLSIPPADNGRNLVEICQVAISGTPGGSAAKKRFLDTVSPCIAVDAYMSGDESLVKLLALVVEDGALALKNYALLEGGEWLVSLDGESALVCEPVHSLALAVPFPLDRIQNAFVCCPNGLACVATTCDAGPSTSNYVAIVDIEGGDDDEEEEEVDAE